MGPGQELLISRQTPYVLGLLMAVSLVLSASSQDKASFLVVLL